MERLLDILHQAYDTRANSIAIRETTIRGQEKLRKYISEFNRILLEKKEPEDIESILSSIKTAEELYKTGEEIIEKTTQTIRNEDDLIKSINDMIVEITKNLDNGDN